jgi:hypothetical protein
MRRAYPLKDAIVAAFYLLKVFFPVLVLHVSSWNVQRE